MWIPVVTEKKKVLEIENKINEITNSINEGNIDIAKFSGAKNAHM